MESEKVKKIKESLQRKINRAENVDDDLVNCVSVIALKEYLTYINELESENESCHEVLADLKTIIKQQNDRIAELEKENAKLLDSVETVQNNRCTTKCELAKKQLKQFAERLKDKYGKSCSEYYPLLLELTSEQIDDLLKEYGIGETK